MQWVRFLRPALSLLSLLALCGCPATDATVAADATEAADPAGEPALVDLALSDAICPASGALCGTGCELAPDIVGWYYRVDKLTVQQPAGPEGAVAATLTSLWGAQVTSDDLVILMHILARAGGKLKVEVASAVLLKSGVDAGKYRELADPGPATLDLTYDGCDFTKGAGGTLKILPPFSTNAVVLPGSQAAGHITPDGETLYGVELTGSLCATNANVIDFKLTPDSSGCVNMGQFMADVGMAPDLQGLPCGDGTSAGFAFSSAVEAQHVTNIADGLEPATAYVCPP